MSENARCCWPEKNGPLDDGRVQASVLHCENEGLCSSRDLHRDGVLQCGRTRKYRFELEETGSLSDLGLIASYRALDARIKLSQQFGFPCHQRIRQLARLPWLSRPKKPIAKVLPPTVGSGT